MKNAMKMPFSSEKNTSANSDNSLLTASSQPLRVAHRNDRSIGRWQDPGAASWEEAAFVANLYTMFVKSNNN